MPVVAHISDLHLQSTVPARQAQIEPILAAINERKPDLVVISGDVTDDGWDSIDELRWAKAWLEERIEGEWFAVPGNHDVGNFTGNSEGVVSYDRVMAWQSVFDNHPTGCFDRVLGAWYLHGINSMVIGSDLYHVYWDRWLSVLPGLARDKFFLLFAHAPFFVISPAESDDPHLNYWLGPGRDRMKWWQQVHSAGPLLICSGHVHQSRLTEVDGIHIAWAPPASGTWVHAPGLPNPPMPEKTGFFLHHLGEDGSVRSELVECAPMLKLYEHNPWP